MGYPCPPQASNTIRIGFDHRGAHVGHGGVAVYIRELAAALAAGYPDDRLLLYEHTVRSSPATGRHFGRAVQGRLGRSVEAALGPLDVMHLTDWAVLRSKAPKVVTIHDVLFETLPETYSDRMRKRLRAVTQKLLRCAQQVVVPCARARIDVIERFGFDADRIHVTPLGCRPLGARPLAATPPVPSTSPSILTVGTFVGRKNHARLLAAFDAMGASDLRLVCAGARAQGDEDFVRAARAHPRVDLVLSPDDATLADLYDRATVVAMPSLGEGFGLPVVEALAMGKPLLVGLDTTCADVAGDAALAVDVRDVEAICNGLERLVTDVALRERLTRSGPERAALYTWERTAATTYAVYKQVCA